MLDVVFIFSNFRIYTPPVPEDGDYCLRFGYNMHGYHVNELRVHVVSLTDVVTVLRFKRKKGTVGNAEWLHKSLVIQLSDKSKVR